MNRMADDIRVGVRLDKGEHKRAVEILKRKDVTFSAWVRARIRDLIRGANKGP